MEKQQLVLIRGLPGSGKSTFAMDNFPDHVILEPDHLFTDLRGEYLFEAQLVDEAEKFVVHLADFSLSRGRSVVITDVFPFAAAISRFQELAKHHSIIFHVYTMTGQYGSVHGVPKVIVERMHKTFTRWPGEIYARNEKR